MSQGRSPAWLLAAGRRRSSYADLRVSDAERTEVADLLSQHYGDGQLDQAEFDQRLDQAMQAKTYRDLSGLFADLPPNGAVRRHVTRPASARSPIGTGGSSWPLAMGRTRRMSGWHGTRVDVGARLWVYVWGLRPVNSSGG